MLLSGHFSMKLRSLDPMFLLFTVITITVNLDFSVITVPL